MGKLLGEGNPKQTFIARWKDIVVLHLLWLVCSIPIITIGASTTAVYYVSLKIIKKEEMSVKEAFFKSFKQNFAQSTFVWILFVSIAEGLGRAYYYLFVVSNDSNTVLKVLIGICTVIVLFCYVYTLPLIARYMNTLKKQILNSVMISIRYLDRTVKIVLMFAIFIAIGFYSLPVAIILFLLSATALFYGVTCYMLPIYEYLEQYIEKEEV